MPHNSAQDKALILNSLEQNFFEIKKDLPKPEQNQLEILIKHVKTLDAQIAILTFQVLLGITQHPFFFAEKKYNELLALLNDKSKEGYFVNLTRPHPNKVLNLLNSFLLQKTGVVQLEKLYQQKKMKIENKVKMNSSSPTALPSFIECIDRAVQGYKPETLSPLNIIDYYPFLRDVNVYLDKLDKYLLNPEQSALREDDLSLVGEMDKTNRAGMNLYEFDTYIWKLKSERLHIANSIYPNLNKFLAVKHEAHALLQGKTKTASELFCNDPTLRHFEELKDNLISEKKLLPRKQKKCLQQFENEALELTYNHHLKNFRETINANQGNPILFSSAKLCLNDIETLKDNRKAKTSFLIDQLSVMTNALEKPLIYNAHLAEKARETHRSGYKTLAGSMLCLVGALALTASIAMTVYGGYLAWPFSLKMSKASISLIITGCGLIGVSSYVMAKSAQFFKSQQQQPLLREHMLQLHHHIDEKVHPSSRP